MAGVIVSVLWQVIFQDSVIPYKTWSAAANRISQSVLLHHCRAVLIYSQPSANVSR
jgi:hypothetical protein